jgi:hypothetical protein
VPKYRLWACHRQDGKEGSGFSCPRQISSTFRIIHCHMAEEAQTERGYMIRSRRCVLGTEELPANGDNLFR